MNTDSHMMAFLTAFRNAYFGTYFVSLLEACMSEINSVFPSRGTFPSGSGGSPLSTDM